MPGIIFNEGPGIADSVFGNCQAPVQMFIENYDQDLEKNSQIKNLFKMGTSENFGDFFTEMTPMDGFYPVGEGGAVPRDSMEEGFGKLMRYMTFSDSFAITMEAIEDAKMMNLTEKPRAFMDGYHDTREIFAASIFGAALNGQKAFNFRGMQFDATGADGNALFHTAHAPKTKGAKQSNCFSNAFSVDALDRAESAMQQFTAEKDKQLTIAPDTIVIANKPDLKRKVFAAIGSDIDPVESTHAFNYQYGRWNVIIWPYLNRFIKKGNEPWMLMDSKFNEKYGGAMWIDRLKLTVDSVREYSPAANVWYGRSRFMAGFRNWRAFCAGGMEGGTDLTTLAL